MQQDIKEKLDLLIGFCIENNIQLEAGIDSHGESVIELNIINSLGLLVQYDEVGRRIN